MLRATALSLLLLATALPLTAGAAIDPCRDYYVCHRVVVQSDPLLVCGAVGLGYQGVGACAYEDIDGSLCVRYAIGYSMRIVCAAMA